MFFFWLRAQKGVSRAGMFVITDSLVLSGGMSQGPAHAPCNSSRCLMGFSLFSVVLTWLCCPGIRDEWQSSAEFSTGWTCDEETSAEEFASYCWWAELMVQILHIPWADCFWGGWGGFFKGQSQLAFNKGKKSNSVFFFLAWHWYNGLSECRTIFLRWRLKTKGIAKPSWAQSFAL